MKKIKRLFFNLLLVLTLNSAFVQNVFADEGPIYTDRKGFAIKGYDVVAYFTENKPIKGSEYLKLIQKSIHLNMVAIVHLLLPKAVLLKLTQNSLLS